jgi:hypothetical protein
VSERPEKTEVRIRRAPKLGIFLLVGAVLGALVTLILTSLFPADPAIGFAASFGYFLLFGAPAGAVVGAVVGLIIDRVSAARARTVTVEHEVVGDQDVAAPE